MNTNKSFNFQSTLCCSFFFKTKVFNVNWPQQHDIYDTFSVAPTLTIDILKKRVVPLIVDIKEEILESLTEQSLSSEVTLTVTRYDLNEC
jgi:hypothetical protein